MPRDLETAEGGSPARKLTTTAHSRDGKSERCLRNNEKYMLFSYCPHSSNLCGYVRKAGALSVMDTRKLSRMENRRAWIRKEMKPRCTPHSPRADLPHITSMLTNKWDCVGGGRMFKDIIENARSFCKT